MTTKSCFSFFKNYCNDLNAITDKFLIYKQKICLPNDHTAFSNDMIKVSM